MCCHTKRWVAEATADLLLQQALLACICWCQEGLSGEGPSWQCCSSLLLADGKSHAASKAQKHSRAVHRLAMLVLVAPGGKVPCHSPSTEEFKSNVPGILLFCSVSACAVRQAGGSCASFFGAVTWTAQLGLRWTHWACSQ